ncbi:hypothetical protein PPERSA_11996 [Pseudocohnilembus persalinus]|uniref:Transmembrane protein n=1 Tax=Pseudocohnilembus persalinus TaxID=266149 RepID=A0A0V0QKU8_PSEPJ|nr:hypothetical protein PPERSA_11996 [Pseudocohnilembus persalinus]|eukprot:KRX02656.1 hypothetical protein PPERSA_11996 [Pseudocohnilembus persalinus]
MSKKVEQKGINTIKQSELDIYSQESSQRNSLLIDEPMYLQDQIDEIKQIQKEKYNNFEQTNYNTKKLIDQNVQKKKEIKVKKQNKSESYQFNTNNNYYQRNIEFSDNKNKQKIKSLNQQQLSKLTILDMDYQSEDQNNDQFLKTQNQRLEKYKVNSPINYLLQNNAEYSKDVSSDSLKIEQNVQKCEQQEIQMQKRYENENKKTASFQQIQNYMGWYFNCNAYAMFMAVSIRFNFGKK